MTRVVMLAAVASLSVPTDAAGQTGVTNASS